MGILNYLNKISVTIAKRNVKKIAIETAEVMLKTAYNRTHMIINALEPHQFAIASIYGRPRWSQGDNFSLQFDGIDTGQRFIEGTNIADIIEYVTKIELSLSVNPILKYIPESHELIPLVGKIAREYVEKHCDSFLLYGKDKGNDLNYLKSAFHAVKELYKCTNSLLTQSELDFLKSKIEIPEIRSISDAVSSGNKILPLPSIEDILKSDNYEDAFEEFNDVNSKIVQIASTFLRAFFLGAEQGFHFINPSFIKSTFGKDTKAAFPGSSIEFVRFAETYFTLTILQDKLFLSHRNVYLTQLFEWTCFNVSAVFFPTPGNAQISTQRFFEAQKSILQKVGYSNIDAFIKGNPRFKNLQ